MATNVHDDDHYLYSQYPWNQYLPISTKSIFEPAEFSNALPCPYKRPASRRNSHRAAMDQWQDEIWQTREYLNRHGKLWND